MNAAVNLRHPKDIGCILALCLPKTKKHKAGARLIELSFLADGRRFVTVKACGFNKSQQRPMNSLQVFKYQLVTRYQFFSRFQ